MSAVCQPSCQQPSSCRPLQMVRAAEGTRWLMFSAEWVSSSSLWDLTSIDTWPRARCEPLGMPFILLQGKKNCFGLQPCRGALNISIIMIRFRGHRQLRFLMEGEALKCSGRARQGGRKVTKLSHMPKQLLSSISLSLYSLIGYL